MAENNREKSLTIVSAVLAAGLIGAVIYVGQLKTEMSRLRARVERSQAGGGSGTALAAPSPPATSSLSTGAARRILTDEQRSLMSGALGGETDPERSVWFATARNDPEAAAYQRELQAVFEDAGWKVRGNAQPSVAIKAGLFFFIAESSEASPPHVSTALRAFESAGIAHVAASGYRLFSEEQRRADPKWVGFEFEPTQTYLIVVGPRPKS